MKKILYVISLAILAAGLVQAEILDLTVDADNSSAPYFNSTLEGVLNDPFVYDPLDPTATAPQQEWNVDGYSSVIAYHGNSGTSYTLSYTLTDGAFTTTGSDADIVVDLWGRLTEQNRDDNITVSLYNGDYSTTVGSPVSLGIPDTPQAYARATIELGTGVTFDRMQITSTDQYFTLLEARTAAIPEPATMGMLAIMATAVLLFRRRFMSK